MRFRFAAMSPPHRDDANCPSAPGPNQGEEQSANARRRLPARLLSSRRWEGDDWPSVKEERCVGEVETAILQGRQPLVLIPLEEHPEPRCMHKTLSHLRGSATLWPKVLALSRRPFRRPALTARRFRHSLERPSRTI